MSDESRDLIDRQITAELVDMAFRGTGLSLLVEPVAVGAMAVLFYNSVHPQGLAIWVSLVLSATAFRAILWHRFHGSSPEVRSQARWGQILAVSMLVSGFVWGGATVLVWPGGSLTGQLALFGIVSMATIGMCGLVTGYIPAANAFLGALLIVVVPVMITKQDVTYYVTVAFALVYALMLLAIAHHIRNLLRRSAELRVDLSDARDAAQAANHTKSEFIANMSHELRTPLNAIIGFSEIIQQQTFGPIENDRYKDYIDDILNSGRHLLGIVTEILDLSKIEAGKMDLNEQECNVAGLVDGCITFLRQKADEAGVMVVNELPPHAPSIVGDERALKQIVINLLSNAIKFTPIGGEVRIRLDPSSTGGISLKIRDTGIGIAPEDIKKVMDPFGQVENAYSRQHEGTGLGLPLVKAMTEMHHGTFHLTSEVDLGTEAIVEFPEDRVIGAFDYAPLQSEVVSVPH